MGPITLDVLGHKFTFSIVARENEVLFVVWGEDEDPDVDEPWVLAKVNNRGAASFYGINQKVVVD